MDNGKCVKFWYHMYGESIYKLNLYAKNGKVYIKFDIEFEIFNSNANFLVIYEESLDSFVNFQVSVLQYFKHAGIVFLDF